MKFLQEVNDTCAVRHEMRSIIQVAFEDEANAWGWCLLLVDGVVSVMYYIGMNKCSFFLHTDLACELKTQQNG